MIVCTVTVSGRRLTPALFLVRAHERLTTRSVDSRDVSALGSFQKQVHAISLRCRYDINNAILFSLQFKSIPRL